MKASYRWLRSLVPQLTATPEELAKKLTHAGLEVESTHHFGAAAASCIVVKVVSMRPHPKKDGLRLVTVDRGGEKQELVCGAPNVPEPGGLVVLAPLGAHLPAKGLTITARDIGGVRSEGMLCSEAELGLSDESDGILVLPHASATAGAPLLAAIPEAEDFIFEIGLTPNRPDCLGHVGLAREICALYGYSFVMPSPKPAPTGVAIEQAGVTLRIEDTTRCPQFSAAAAVSIKIGPSPLWQRYRLTSLGVRPINNVVDITNIVMLEFGHPMHAFDFDKLARGPEGSPLITVRTAKEGEKLKTLDGNERTLSADDLVVCDAAGPLALAGVMGGERSEISESTNRVLLECAYFDPRTVRRTARRHSLHSEASHRFERGVDPSDIDAVLLTASAHLARQAGAEVLAGHVHAQGSVRFPKTARLRVSRMRNLLGLDIPWAEATSTLERLGCKLVRDTGAMADFELPSHRPDMTREVDLIEEVVRVHGMDNVPETLPALRATRDVGTSETFAERVRREATGVGLSEAVILAMTSREALENVKAETPAVVLKNPLGEQGSVLRTSLLPGLFESVARAKAHGEPSSRLFAMGPLFRKTTPEAEKKGGPDAALPFEQPAFAMVLSGYRPVHLKKPERLDVLDLKGFTDALLERLTGQAPTLVRKDLPAHLHPRGAAWLLVRGVRVGSMGPVHPDVSDSFALDEATFVLELDLAAVEALGKPLSAFQPIPRFPPVTRDIAVVVRLAQAAGDLLAEVKDAAGGLASDVSLFDRFTGAGVPADHVSYAMRVQYRNLERTLTDAEVDACHAKVIERLGMRFGAQLRG
ncbi:MAG: phenylalanine--tRNA ligase subunit beta [Polyangiaceae bacterium]